MELKRNDKERAIGGVGFSFDLYNPDVLDFIEERSYRFWEEVNKTTKKKLHSVLKVSVEEGIGVEELTVALQESVFAELEEFSGFNRARRIARTETTIALNQGANFAYEQSGVVEGKSWLTAGDENVRESHVAAEAQGVIPIDERFGNGLMFPGDPEGAVSELVNCRCSLIPEISIGENE